MREGIRIYMPSGHLLQPVISHRGSRAKSGLDIALLEQAALLRRVRPDPGKAIGLQFHLHGQRFLRARVLLLQLAQLALDAQNILHVVAQFVREHVGLREFAGRPETALQFVKKTKIDVNPLVAGTIKRAVAASAPPHPD